MVGQNQGVQVHGFSETWVTPLIRRWRVVVGLGVVMVVVGVVLLVDLAGAVRTLALLVALGLVLTGIDELSQAARHSRPWPAQVLAAVWIATGVVALVWPGVTLWALALTTGVGLIIGGGAEIAFTLSYRRELPFWFVWLVDGVVTVVLGVFALSWPGATIAVLAVLLGLRVLLRGMSTVAFGLGLRRLDGMTSPHVPT